MYRPAQIRSFALPRAVSIPLSALALAMVTTLGAPVPALAKSTTPVYRLCQKGTNFHLWTTDANEYKTLPKHGWIQEGIAWHSPTSGFTRSVYRLYNPNDGNHLYTTNLVEYEFLGLAGWKKEGKAFKAELTSNYPVYRLSFYSNNDHLLTLDKNEYDVLGKRGWKQEDVAFRVTAPGSVA